jgi:hypothetical protein
MFKCDCCVLAVFTVVGVLCGHRPCLQEQEPECGACRVVTELQQLLSCLLASWQALSAGGWAALPVPAAAEAWRQRAAWLQQAEVSAAGSSELPDLSTKALLDSLGSWLGPHLAGVRSAGQLQKLPWKDIFKGQVSEWFE